VVAAVIVAAVTSIPGIAAFFQLRWRAPAAVYPLAPLLDLTAMALHRRGAGRGVVVGLSLLASTALQLFCGLLVACTSVRGAPVLAILLLFTAAYHGFMYRATLRGPYMALGTVASLAVTVLANFDPARWPLMAVLVPATLGASLLVGSFATASDRLRVSSERVRAALNARMLEDQSARAEQLGATVEQMAMWNHDLRNAVTVAMGHLMVLRLSLDEAGNSRAGPDLSARLASMKNSLEVIAVGLDKLRGATLATREATGAECVELGPVIAEVCAAVGVRFPLVRLVASTPTAPAWVAVRGGAVCLYRMLENLLVNGCEGDGARGATVVELEVGLLDGQAALEVRDDGPGFRTGQLSRAICGFETSKPSGTGLGLYTVERLANASGGSVSRANRPGGGASVVLRLPTCQAAPGPERASA